MTRFQKAFVAAIIPAGVCLGAAAWFSSREISLRRAESERETRVMAILYSNRVRAALEKHRIALEQLSTFFEQSNEVTEEEFTAFADGTLRLTPLCLRIPVVDPAFRVRWVHPVDENRDLIGFDVTSHREGHEANLRAVRTREAALSAPLRLVTGDQGFVLVSPAFRQSRFAGNVVCSIRTRDFFNAMNSPELLQRYVPSVTDSGITLFDSAPEPGEGSSAPVITEPLALGGRTWHIGVRLREQTYLAQLHWGQAAYWTLGCLLAMAAACVGGGIAWRSTAIIARLRDQGTTLRQTQQRLDDAMQQLMQAEKLGALGELVAGVAHEVNNPLTAILGYSQLAMSRTDSPEVRRRLETVVSEAERAGRIVRNLLTFARKQPPEKKLLGLNGIIEKTLELKAYHFRVNQIQLHTDLDPHLPMTMLDFQQMQQVLLNLLNNAEQAIQETGRGGRISITTRRSGSFARILVQDDGPGMTEEIRKRVFEPFFTTKKEGKGTGLGLSLCYGIISEHGGTIRAEKGADRGATFVIDLPITGGTRAEGEGVPAALPAAGPSKGRVFVVDDEPSLQAFLVDLLTSDGFMVDTASDAPEALRKIETGRYDLIITDMKMPNGTGEDLYRAVARIHPGMAKRMIFTTGDGASAGMDTFVREAGNKILLKPFTVADLRKAVSAVVQS